MNENEDDHHDTTPEDTVHDTMRREAEAERLNEQLTGDVRTCEHCGKELPASDMSQLKDGTYLCESCDLKAREAEEKARLEALVRGTFTYGDSTNFKDMLKALQSLLPDEVTFSLDNDGLHVRMQDAERWSMTVLDLRPGDFEQFLCTKPGKFAVDVKRLLDKPFKSVYKNETVTFTVGYDKANLLLSSSLNRTFPIILLDPSEEEVPMPKVKHTANVKIVTETMRTILRDCDSNPVRISATPKQLVFQEKGDESEMPVNVPLPKGHDGLLVLETHGHDEIKANYSATYLRAFCEVAFKLSEITGLSFGDDLPMRVSMESLRAGTFEFWLAPRVETE